MYRRNAQGWSKHFDFIVVDLISLQIAFVLAVALRNQGWIWGNIRTTQEKACIFAAFRGLSESPYLCKSLIV